MSTHGVEKPSLDLIQIKGVYFPLLTLGPVEHVCLLFVDFSLTFATSTTHFAVLLPLFTQ